MKHKPSVTAAIPPFLNSTKEKLFDRLKLPITNITLEPESSEYDACHFQVQNKKIRFRQAKVTPKKIGQFVTLWKRNKAGITEPFDSKDNTDIYIISANQKTQIGYFFFTKQILSEKGILSGKHEGKRGFRIYPSWDTPANKQGLSTKKWQIHYFVELTGKEEDLESISKLLGLQRQ
ncbi:MepB protein [Leptospira congkakensis]|uniref:MepB protein n=1 Tax=Leptospira congkakensis TaxID=2484932 RepID=A0A4Z1A506_9LEPT|nr:MepB family protein [Leptospira congkakensis]TGL87379.1 MepB protein [Leptospira congkakensis]TGL96946.1 MepB protein [Leptospira congkakensis]TGL97797.1 MepB protein [Leptospira congkakensis]